MCNLIHTKPNLLILEANCDNHNWDCSIIPITDCIVIDNISSLDLKSVTCAYYYKKTTSVLSLKISPQLLSCFKNELLRSREFRYSVWTNFQNHVHTATQTIYVKICLTNEPKCSIDYRLYVHLASSIIYRQFLQLFFLFQWNWSTNSCQRKSRDGLRNVLLINPRRSIFITWRRIQTLRKL